MRELWLLDAKEAIQTDVFLNLYADTRDITVTEEELEKKIEVLKRINLMQMYPSFQIHSGEYVRV